VLKGTYTCAHYFTSHITAGELHEKHNARVLAHHVHSSSLSGSRALSVTIARVLHNLASWEVASCVHVGRDGRRKRPPSRARSKERKLACSVGIGRA
jgi:hypothetical protein